MPFVTVRIEGPIDAEGTERLRRGVTALMADVLGKRADLTAVLIERAPAGAWGIGGTPSAVAAHLDAKVTAGTNDAAQKARFVADAHALLRAVLGSGLPPATYVVIDEIPGDAWGYAGRTQADRAGARPAAA